MTDIERFKSNLLDRARECGFRVFQEALKGEPLQDLPDVFTHNLKKEESLHPSGPLAYRETIHHAVVQNFNKTKAWNCKDLVEVYHQISDWQEADAIVNSLEIRDPATGSGRYLVAALHELICIKSRLGILLDRTGQPLQDCQVEVVKEELVIKDNHGRPFIYNPDNKESQLIQETLFHEKETLIGNCLFGADENPSLVEICRLRLWIELLKSAYYTDNPPEETYASPVCYLNSGELREEYKPRRQLVSLPEIVNIKCGSLPD